MLELLTVQDIQNKYNEVKKLDFIFFWGGYLSNWYVESFEIEGVTYFCVEQYMMAKKAMLFNDKVALQRIMQSTDQSEIKQIGREVKNFKDELWSKERVQVVYDGNYAKFTQNEYLKNYILNTKDKILVEASPFDRVWGVGLGKEDRLINNPNNWRGTNYLGFVLMSLREQIR